MAAPRIAIGPNASSFAKDAVRAGAACRSSSANKPTPWSGSPPTTLTAWSPCSRISPASAGSSCRSRASRTPWRPASSTAGRVWTSAKGLYARPVAEHALMLALAGLRILPERIRAHSWGTPAGTSLYGAPVTILGGGGITEELLRLLAPFGVEATVVRRQAEPVPGAARTVTTAELDDVLPGALVVFLALALTPETEPHHRRRPARSHG